ncbi:hypothetical protein F5884DRAFT_823098 [Xylogone sp. PMI_703]|nr:hypothetical protein F5884DRAFT_823098 [Xylogone sp. PMI_703]
MFSSSLDRKAVSQSGRHGLACEECRRRKSRCDGRKPRCSICEEYGIVCTTNTSRPARGPKRGYLKALRIRVAELERRLVEQQREGSPSDSPLDLEDSDRNMIPRERPARMPTVTPRTGAKYAPLDEFVVNGEVFRLQEALDTSWISDMMREELNELYFDRVHPFAPMLHRRRYFAWAKKPVIDRSHTCLQFAMWTLSASLSPQCQNIRDNLYGLTRQTLHALELPDNGFICGHYQRSWTSAGRSFRLVQLMGFYQIDAAESIATYRRPETEKRTFWMAYCLDRFIGIHNGWPLTFNEHIKVFQNGLATVEGFLSELITADDREILKPFTECVVLATIYGRAFSHRQQSLVERVYGDVSQEFWDRHHWLVSILTNRIQRLSLFGIPAREVVDLMQLFTRMVAQTAIHPFTPFPLYIAAEFLFSRKHGHEFYDSKVRKIQDALRNL